MLGKDDSATDLADSVRGESLCGGLPHPCARHVLSALLLGGVLFRVVEGIKVFPAMIRVSYSRCRGRVRTAGVARPSS